MTQPVARDPIYRRRRFEAEIIELCVRWYITYRLSYRDLVAMMAERGLAVSHTTILRWVIRYVPEFEKRWSRWARDVNSRAESSSAAAPAPGESRWKYVLVRNCPYLSNIVEQDHRAIKRRCASMLGFKSFGNAAITLAGIESLRKACAGTH
jgi:transposase-like protein